MFAAMQKSANYQIGFVIIMPILLPLTALLNNYATPTPNDVFTLSW